MEFQRANIEELKLKHKQQLAKVEEAREELRYYAAKATAIETEIFALESSRDYPDERSVDFVEEFY